MQDAVRRQGVHVAQGHQSDAKLEIEITSLFLSYRPLNIPPPPPNCKVMNWNSELSCQKG